MDNLYFALREHYVTISTRFDEAIHLIFLSSLQSFGPSLARRAHVEKVDWRPAPKPAGQTYMVTEAQPILVGQSMTGEHPVPVRQF